MLNKNTDYQEKSLAKSHSKETEIKVLKVLFKGFFESRDCRHTRIITPVGPILGRASYACGALKRLSLSHLALNVYVMGSVLP